MWRGYGYGMMGDWGAGWMFFHGFFWLLVLALIVVGIVLLVRSTGSDDKREQTSRRARGLDILEERYARGEINREEYLEKKRDLLD